ncbi:MAG: PilZ domain-containing protein [Aestuariivirga sp.]|uniref:PilZ domain-containing protein n=1 Tax=Aestuariivirga sp. TaxID=2650926 RepID=UPI0030167312
MPADAMRVAPSPLDQRRRSERRPCPLAVTVRCNAGDHPARLIDLSSGGAGIRIDTLVALKPGTRFFLIHPALGEVPCILRWAMHPRYGAEFQMGNYTLSRIGALYDSLPPGPGDII